MFRERLPLGCLQTSLFAQALIRLARLHCFLLTSMAWNHRTSSGGQSGGYRLTLSLCLRSMTWSPPCCDARTAAARSLSLSCSAFFAFSALPSVLGVCGSLGVGAREVHGDKFERKPCLLSGADILSTRESPLPGRSLLSHDSARYREAGNGPVSSFQHRGRGSARPEMRR